jgi:L-ascorbate metabolism protein UlaG (beta-lactamase superfamily)
VCSSDLVSIENLPRLAGVCVSHAHYDHFDMEAFSAYPDKEVPIVVKRGKSARARKAGFRNVTEVDPWETVRLGPVAVTAAPARHGVPENTYLFQDGQRTVFFGADTLLNPGLRDVAERFPSI